MKNIVIAALMVSIFSACNFSSNRLSIRTTRSNGSTQYHATFPEGKTAELPAFIAKVLHDNRVAHQLDLQERYIRLAGGMNFKAKLEPGELTLSYTKSSNSPHNHQELDRLCDRISYFLH